ncbi:unnamed protein product [Onchocerca flexuosa]|uniref:Solute carrier organic anion transporter family member n=1 Tax=Onchocerca flexuosa TaxID=387005 RepID=A0A183I019_9BILA|nr:unnamed protein product [Onchocerca flexuosa]
MQPTNEGKVDNILHNECAYVDDNVRDAETRSAPGDLEKPSSSREYHFTCDAVSGKNLEDSEALNIFDDKSLPFNSEESRKRPVGHYRNCNNGFASGPPWPVQKREKPWSTVCVWQKQQQIQAIEKEINVMATESLVGLRSWRPKWLQRFGTKNWMLLWLCWFCAVQGLLVNGLVPSAITSIERRFQFSSSTIGRIMQFYDFGYVLLCIPVSYFGGRHSKPMVLAIGLLLMALGSFIFTMPHNFSDSYTSTYNAHELSFSKCDLSHPLFGARKNYSVLNNSLHSLMSGASAEALQSCPSPENQPGTFRYVFLFCFAHFLHGIGATPLFTLGVSYIDENVGPALSSLYLGIFYAFAIFGPAFGFLMSSSFLRYHTDFLQSELHIKILNIDETDPKWVGAWWIGFQIASVLALIAVFPIMVLPKVLPESLKWHRTRLHEETIAGARKRTPECCGIPSASKTVAICGPLLPTDSTTTVQTITIGESMPALQNNRGPIWYHIWLDVRHIPIAIYRIISNGSYMLITFTMAVDGFIITGASTFMSKYLERQFSVAPSKANMLIGCIMVPMAGIGTMFSGFIIQRFRLSCVKTLKFCIVLLMCTLVLSPMYLVYCDHDPLAGIEEFYEVDIVSNSNENNNDTEILPSLKSMCNHHCDCVPSEYHPVCAEFYNDKQISFYSPCFAGCQENYEPLRKMYYNCSCVPKNTKFGYKTVKNGLCESKCRGLFGFLALFAPFCFFAFAFGVPLISVVLRTVDYAERSFALGIQWILVRVIGTIPAPVLFGWMFDVSCIRYNLDVCSGNTIAMALLICTLVFFSSQMRDDPLPAEAVIGDSELSQVKEELAVIIRTSITGNN